VPHAGLARNNAAIDATAFGGIPFDDVAAAENFQPRLSDRLALLQRHGDRHFLDAFARQPRRLEDDVGALGGRRMPPDPQLLLCRRQRGVKVGAGRVRYDTEDALVGGIEDRLAIRVLPFTCDEKLQFWICWHRRSHSRVTASTLQVKRCIFNARAQAGSLIRIGPAALPNSSLRVDKTG